MSLRACQGRWPCSRWAGSGARGPQDEAGRASTFARVSCGERGWSGPARNRVSDTRTVRETTFSDPPARALQGRRNTREPGAHNNAHPHNQAGAALCSAVRSSTRPRACNSLRTLAAKDVWVRRLRGIPDVQCGCASRTNCESGQVRGGRSRQRPPMRRRTVDHPPSSCRAVMHDLGLEAA